MMETKQRSNETQKASLDNKETSSNLKSWQQGYETNLWNQANTQISNSSKEKVMILPQTISMQW